MAGVPAIVKGDPVPAVCAPGVVVPTIVKGDPAPGVCAPGVVAPTMVKGDPFPLDWEPADVVVPAGTIGDHGFPGTRGTPGVMPGARIGEKG